MCLLARVGSQRQAKATTHGLSLPACGPLLPSLPSAAMSRPPALAPSSAEKCATALMSAAVHGRADVVSTLLSNGVRAVVRERALWSRSAALSACLPACVWLQGLLQGRAPTRRPGGRAPPAAAANQTCSCLLLLPCASHLPRLPRAPSALAPQADPAVALPGGGGRTARELAAMYGHSLVVEVLDEYREQVGVPIVLAPGGRCLAGSAGCKSRR